MASNSNDDRSYQHDRERVVTHDLAVVLEQYVEAYERERPQPNESGHGRLRPKALTFMGAMEYMSIKTGFEPRRLWGIINRETYTTSYWMADLILTRLELTHRMHEIRELPYEVSATAKAKSKNGDRWINLIQSQEQWLEYLDKIGCRR